MAHRIYHMARIQSEVAPLLGLIISSTTHGKLGRVEGGGGRARQIRAAIKKKRVQAGNTHSDIIITELSKLGVEGWSVCSSPPRQLLRRAKVCGSSSQQPLPSLAGSLTDARFLGFLLLHVSVMLPFSSPNLYISHLYRRMLLEMPFTPEL